MDRVGPPRTSTHDLLDRFDLIVESSVVGLRKPDPAIFELTCRRLGTAPHACVFLDDLGVNCKPARALGMTTIKVVDPDDALLELESVLGRDRVLGGGSGPRRQHQTRGNRSAQERLRRWRWPSR
jgi:putative hydrolase of the HAD superfamily